MAARFSSLDEARAALDRELHDLSGTLEYERAWLTEVYGIEPDEAHEADSAVGTDGPEPAEQEGRPHGETGAP